MFDVAPLTVLLMGVLGVLVILVGIARIVVAERRVVESLPTVRATASPSLPAAA